MDGCSGTGSDNYYKGMSQCDHSNHCDSYSNGEAVRFCNLIKTTHSLLRQKLASSRDWHRNSKLWFTLLVLHVWGKSRLVYCFLSGLICMEQHKPSLESNSKTSNWRRSLASQWVQKSYDYAAAAKVHCKKPQSLMWQMRQRWEVRPGCIVPSLRLQCKWLTSLSMDIQER